MTTRCPTCGRSPRRTVADRVVAGDLDPKRAPKLHAAWDTLRREVERWPGISAVDLRWILAEDLDLAHKSTDHLVRAAVAAGLLHRSYEIGGTPRRLRARIWPGPGEASW